MTSRDDRELLLDELCNDCHFVWKPGIHNATINVKQLESDLLIDVKYDSSQRVATFTLLSYLYYSVNDFTKANDYAKQAHQLIQQEEFDNGSKYISISVYLHVLFHLHEWAAMEPLFDEIKMVRLSDTDESSKLLIKLYAFKKTSSSPEILLEICRKAEKWDKQNPEVYLQKALVLRRERKLKEPTHKTKASEEEITALTQAIGIWKDEPHFVTYPEILLADAYIENTLYSEIRKYADQHKKPPILEWDIPDNQAEENYNLIKHIEENLWKLYLKIDENYHYANRAVATCIRAYNTICSIKYTAYQFYVLKRKRSYIIHHSKSYKEDESILFYIGHYYFYQKDYETAKQYLEKCLHIRWDNIKVDEMLFKLKSVEQKATAAAELRRKYDSFPKSQKSNLYFTIAQHFQYVKKYDEAKCYYFDALELNPELSRARVNLRRILMHDLHYSSTDKINTMMSLGKLYLIVRPRSEQDIQLAYHNLHQVYQENPSFKNLRMLYCEVLIAKAELENSAILLEEVVDISQKCYTMKKYTGDAYFKLAELTNKNCDKIKHLLLACQFDHFQSCQRLIELMKSLSNDDCHPWNTTTEAYKQCAIIDPRNRQYINVEAANLDEISCTISEILHIKNINKQDSNLINMDILRRRQKRYELCCKYETLAAHKIPLDGPNKDVPGLMHLCEDYLVQTRIDLDRSFKQFHSKFFSSDSKTDIYYPQLSKVPKSFGEARILLCQILKDRYNITGFKTEFPELLDTLTSHQCYMDGLKTINPSLKKYFQFTNQSKHEKSIAMSDGYLKKLKVSLYDFTQIIYDHVESIATALFSAERIKSKHPPLEVLNMTKKQNVIIFGTSFVEGIKDEWFGNQFMLMDIICDECKGDMTLPKCTEYIKANLRKLQSCTIFVIQLSLSDIEHDDYSVEYIISKLFEILDKIAKNKQHINLMVSGIPNLPDTHKLKLCTNELNKKLKCQATLDLGMFGYVEHSNYYYGKNGHIEEKSWSLTLKGKKKWIQNLQNALTKFTRAK